MVILGIKEALSHDFSIAENRKNMPCINSHSNIGPCATLLSFIFSSLFLLLLLGLVTLGGSKNLYRLQADLWYLL